MDNYKGAGDHNYNKRIPVPSSRKFTPIPPLKNETVKLKLQHEIGTLNKRGILQKSKSVAEITPTKTKQKRLKSRDPATPITLHATPRPVVVDSPPSRRNNEEVKASWLIYRRMLLHAWRRSRERFATLRESSRRHQEQINQLEIQVNCLKDLRKSESAKCQETLNEVKEFRIRLEEVENENCNLTKLNGELNNELQTTKSDLLKTQHLTSDLERKEQELAKSEEKKLLLKSKLQKQHLVFKMQQKTFKAALEDARAHSQIYQTQLQNEKDTHTQEIIDLVKKYETALSDLQASKNELGILFDTKDKLEDENEKLNVKINSIISELEKATMENIKLRMKLNDIERKKEEMWNNAKDVLIVVWTVLKHNAYLMLPALPPFN